ncbi:hypothetical protein niasHS_014504 [Heterodera schachtii]|uniref:Arginyl-tRNA--protein transferase 1 n=1 Tax=Heterodera schachtii TaxID=97005 RepID=A0ABD2IGN3_HETSC
MARQQLNIRRRSVVSYVGISEHGQCGYCKFTKRAHNKAKFAASTSECNASVDASTVASSTNNDGQQQQQQANPPNAHDENANDDANGGGDSAVFGLWAHQLTVHHYQWLANRGWRRSGRFLYKPLMDRTCCPQYTIRLDVHKFRLSRTQKRVLRTMRDFLRTDQRPKERRWAVADDGETAQGKAPQQKQRDGERGGGQAQKRRRRRGSSETAQPTTAPQKQRETTAPANGGGGGMETEQNEQTQGNTSGEGEGTTKTKTLDSHGMERQPKKKEMRRRRAEERLRARGIDLEEFKRQRAARESARRRTVQSFLNGYDEPSWAHTLQLRLIGQPSLELDEDFDEEFELFKRYQMQVHRERASDLTPDAFRRFLASSPLFPSPPHEGQQQQQARPPLPHLGSYHQQYRLDGRLIAVAVIDLLPHCLSAKYFFYDPEFAFLSLGTYSALREIAFTQQLAQHRPDLHFYYMGFYLFDCPKMRYKNRFRPSELLCDHCFNWVPVTECDRILEANGGRFSTFHPSAEPTRAELDSAQMDQILCLCGDPPRPLTFASLRNSLETAAAAPSSSADSQRQNGRGEGQEEMGQHGVLLSVDGIGPGALLRQLTDKVRAYARHVGPAAVEMVLVLTDAQFED